MFESILGSLIAAVIVKTLGEVHERLSDLKKRLAAGMDIVKKTELEKEVESLEKELETLKQNLVPKASVRAISELFEKIHTLGRIKSFLERAYGMVKDGLTDDKLQYLLLAFDDMELEKNIEQLTHPSEPLSDANDVKNLVNEINAETAEMAVLLKNLPPTFVVGMISTSIRRCRKLEKKLYRLAQLGAEDV
jgi:HAMP domain-containing protein